MGEDVRNGADMIYVVSHRKFEMMDGVDEGYKAIYVGNAHGYAHREGFLTDELSE